MSKKLFDFQKQLNIGNQGEQDFIKFYPELSPVKSVDRKFDFILGNNLTVELKTDSYNMMNTENFFMERFSDMQKRTLGGPWRAKRDRVRYFVYYYSQNGTFFWFETDQLCDVLKKEIATKKYKPKIIRNKGWNAKGYTIPREKLKHIILKEHTF